MKAYKAKMKAHKTKMKAHKTKMKAQKATVEGRTCERPPVEGLRGVGLGYCPSIGRSGVSLGGGL